jgi:hypothetical protein
MRFFKKRQSKPIENPANHWLPFTIKQQFVPRKYMLPDQPVSRKDLNATFIPNHLTIDIYLS